MPLLPHFGHGKNFPQKTGSMSLSPIYLTLTSCKKSEKSNEPILRKWHDRWKAWQKELISYG